MVNLLGSYFSQTTYLKISGETQLDEARWPVINNITTEQEQIWLITKTAFPAEAGNLQPHWSPLYSTVAHVNHRRSIQTLEIMILEFQANETLQQRKRVIQNCFAIFIFYSKDRSYLKLGDYTLQNSK